MPNLEAERSGVPAVLEALGVQGRFDLAGLTTWRVGGPAEYFWEGPVSGAEPVLRVAEEIGIDVHVLGRGSNVLVADQGVAGLVISTRLWTKLTYQGTYIEAEAGVPLPKLAREACKWGIAGFEFMAGIPGSVGGGVVMNAGLTSGETADVSSVLDHVLIRPHGADPRWVAKSELALGYRSSSLSAGSAVVLAARFHIGARDAVSAIQSRMQVHLEKRRAKQPIGRPSAGSTFTAADDGTPAGMLLEKVGAKGLRKGGAYFSHKHANWIINDGGASAADIDWLIREAQRMVQAEFGVHLRPEVSRIGWDGN